MARNASALSQSPVRVHKSPPLSSRREREHDKDGERERGRTKDRDRDRGRERGRDKGRGGDKDRETYWDVNRDRESSPGNRRRTNSNTHNDAVFSGKGRTSSPLLSKEKLRESGSRSRSPSPRTKRLRRSQAEKDEDRGRNHGNGRGSEKEGERVKGLDREIGNEQRRDKRLSGRDRDITDYGDDVGDRSRPSKSRKDKSDASPNHYRNAKSRRRSISPEHHHNLANNRGRDEMRGSREDDDRRNGEDDSVSKMKAAADALEEKNKVKPSFELSGKLAEETNRVRGVTLLFNEPPDARKPDIRWRLYVFKAGEVLNEPLYIHRQSCYLFGRERRVADIPTDHPSCSKQHAVIQFRQVEEEQPDGMMSKKIRPYLMDLGSTNKTFINDEPVEPQRYYELREKDTIRFGNSSREYVLLHENSIH